MPEATLVKTTVMLADICGSTELFNRLGDEKAATIITVTLNRAAAKVEKHGGRVMRSKGDDVLCIFSDPLNALQAAIEVHAGLSSHSVTAAHELAMRIGINSGPVVVSQADIQGDAINTAARLSAFAKAGQTIVSSHTMELLDSPSSVLIRPIGQISLKGKSGALSVFELLDLNEQDEITQVGSSPLQFPQSNRLSLKYQSRQEKLDYLLVRFLLGRNPDCDLVMDHPLVSRHHAEIRYQNNEFVLVDFSTNGTALITKGQSRDLHHNQAALRGHGSIFLGGTVYNRSFEIVFHASGGSRGFSQKDS